MTETILLKHAILKYYWILSKVIDKIQFLHMLNLNITIRHAKIDHAV